VADRETLVLTDEEILQLAGLLDAGWQPSLQAKLGVGWDSNPLLSSATKEESGFARIGVEGMFWRPDPAPHAVEWISFLNAAYRRMFSAPSLPDETEAFFQGEARWRPTPPFRLSLLAQAFYLDSVLDLSTESERLSTPLQDAGFKTGVTARWDATPHWWAEASSTYGRSNFRLIPEDYQEYRLGFRSGWQASPGGLKVAVGVRESFRRYSDRTVTTIAGRPLAGPGLRYRTPELELSVEETADWHGRWHFSATATGSRNDDNGAGYFNYRLGRALVSADWRSGAWEVESSFAASRYRWDEQLAGIGLDPPRRERRDAAFTLQVNRRINPRWFVFVDAERECVSSNDSSAAYNLTSFSTGLGLNL
jgi:hypothetical protein